MIGIGSVNGFLLKVQFSLKGQLCLNILLCITRDYNQMMSVKCPNKLMFPFQGSERASRRIGTSGRGLVDATEDMDKDWEEGHRGTRRERDVDQARRRRRRQPVYFLVFGTCRVPV